MSGVLFFVREVHQTNDFIDKRWDGREDASALFQVKLFEFFPHEIDNKFQRLVSKEKKKAIKVQKTRSFIFGFKLILFLIILTLRNYHSK